MAKGKIGVTSENIFPVIKKFLYSEHEIFLRELVANAVDATQKLKTLASIGEFKGELGDLTIRISIDKKKKTLTISDRGVGMTAEEIDNYINQIALSSAQEFLEKYKNDAQSLIGHFGLGFYSAFMVAKKVEIFTLSYKEGATAQHWSCNGDPEYILEETIKADRGTDVILHIDEDNKEFLEESRIQELLNKYCKFLPIPIAFGKQKEWKDGKYVETDKDNIINNTEPAWIKKPEELKEEDYLNFYHELFPMNEDPLFYIHLNVDYPFHLTGILYFPKIKNNIDIQRNKIHLYCNQVYVTDHVENIVPEYLTLLHGVIDSPDIPLNVSRSYLQNDANVRKISNHITKKVADRLQEIFKNDRSQFEEKWDDLKLFIEYGMLTDEKFYERAEKFALFKNVDGKYFTFDEYKSLISENQKDKNGDLIYLYATNVNEQYSYIQQAKDKGYDVLLMDGQLDMHLISQLEHKWEKTRFVRVDSDVIDKLIQKEEIEKVPLTDTQREMLTIAFNSQLPTLEKTNFIITFEHLKTNDSPVFITQNEFLRRMKQISAIEGGMMQFYGEMPESFNLVINTAHPLIDKILNEINFSCQEELEPFETELKEKNEKLNQLKESHKGKKEEEIPAEEKDELENLQKELDELKEKKKTILTNFANQYKPIRQLIDLALLANNLLKGEPLANFVKRSFELL
ncbi:MAG: molecular chaperone HtpG [Paludibacteraceae bacterium]|nr:molecular chaperone HtpG [Paludibacteraceae bacterium]